MYTKQLSQAERQAKWDEEKQQFYEAIRNFGWDRIITDLTHIKDGVDYIGTKNARRFDICPSYSCSSHQLSEKKRGNFTFFEDTFMDDGAGYCFKCKEKYYGINVVAESLKCSIGEAFDEIKHLINFKVDPNFVPRPKAERNNEPRAPKPPTEKELRQAKRNKNKMQKIWDECIPLNDPRALPAAKYFASRGITDVYGAMLGEVMYHEGLDYYIPIHHPEDNKDSLDEVQRLDLISYCMQHPSFDSFINKKVDGINAPIMANMGKHPCIILIIRTPTGEPRRLHRIFIDSEGGKANFYKAGFEVKKMMAGGVGLEIEGCSCFLDSPCSVVGVSEGFETSLAVKQGTQMPMDCTITAGGLKSYEPRLGVKFVFIFEDKDKSKTGENVAKALEERLKARGYNVLRLIPPMDLNGRKTVDWLDVLNELGEGAFPEVATRWRELLK